MPSDNRMNTCKHLDGNSLLPTRPLIGLTGNFVDGCCSLASAYYTSVLKAGGVPLVIPPTGNDEIIAHILGFLDGIVLTGGADLNPLLIGEEPIPQLRGINAERDSHELLVTRMAADLHIPILGICRGIQVIGAAFGGLLYQDIYTQHHGTTCKHDQNADRWVATHTVELLSGSQLYNLFQTTRLAVNSFHHQAVKTPPQGFMVSATAPDGIIEAMESVNDHQILAVQWHPECFIMHNDESMMPIFHWLIKEASSHKEQQISN